MPTYKSLRTNLVKRGDLSDQQWQVQLLALHLVGDQHDGGWRAGNFDITSKNHLDDWSTAKNWRKHGSAAFTEISCVWPQGKDHLLEFFSY